MQVGRVSAGAAPLAAPTGAALPSCRRQLPRRNNTRQQTGSCEGSIVHGDKHSQLKRLIHQRRQCIRGRHGTVTSPAATTTTTTSALPCPACSPCCCRRCTLRPLPSHPPASPTPHTSTPCRRPSDSPSRGCPRGRQGSGGVVAMAPAGQAAVCGPDSGGRGGRQQQQQGSGRAPPDKGLPRGDSRPRASGLRQLRAEGGNGGGGVRGGKSGCSLKK